ncbi:MAG: PEGA domain-containing protein [Myxococcales bacterium]|nr:PEGA domain-containing protein [Myxococcales bacterium]
MRRTEPTAASGATPMARITAEARVSPAWQAEPVEAAAGHAREPAVERERVAAGGRRSINKQEAQSVAGEALGGAPVLEAAAQSVVGASDANAGEPAAAQDAGVQPEASGRPALDTEAVPLSVEPDPSGVVAAGQPAQDAEPEASAQPAVEPGAPALESPGAGEVAHTKMEAEAPQEPDAPGTGGLAPAQTDALAASALAAAELASVRDPSTLDDETTLPEGTPRDLAELDAADTLTDDHPVSAVLMRTTAEVDEPEPEDRLAIDAIAAGWEQPVLPAGESPWSEVVSPRGTHRRDYAEFPGFDEDLPRGSNPPAAAPPQAVEYVQEDPSEPSVADVAAAVSGFDTRKVAGGVLAVLVILGLFAFIARSGGGQANAPADVALPGQEFVLESRPAGAWVVAEADGRVLGKTPLAFLVPAGSHPQVFLVAPGHEPMRMELMERGGVEARLLPAGEAGCTVTLSSPDGVQVTAFDDTPVPMGEVPVQGALLVRAAADQEQQGARLVTCPERGGTAKASLHFNPRWAGAPIRITEPAGVAAYMNGDPVGRVPTTGHVDRAFVEVRVDDAEGMSESRWVPARGPLEVRMPTPKPRRRPVLVVPDNRPEDADANVEISAPDTVAPAAPTGRVERLLKAGHKHLKAGRSRKASQAFRECLRIAPNEPTCTEGLGLLYRRIGKADKAKVYFTRFLELVPSGPDAERVRGYLAE